MHGGLNAFYRGFESTLNRMHPLFKALDYQRLERPVAAIERTSKACCSTAACAANAC